jgi:hypothetical protein
MVLELLDDGKWHGIEESLLRLELSEREFRVVADFLGKYGFAKIDERNRRVKINRDFIRLDPVVTYG